jgi:hypothetical protein
MKSVRAEQARTAGGKPAKAKYTQRRDMYYRVTGLTVRGRDGIPVHYLDTGARDFSR